MGIHWTIEYWVDGQVKRHSSHDSSWKDAPREDIIYVYVDYTMVRPYGNPDTRYRVICKGTDYYFLQEVDGVTYFGGFNDEHATPTSANVDGNIHRYAEGNIEREPYQRNTKPDFVDECNVKAGVWVQEPWATMLGLSRTDHEPIVVEDCCD